MLKFKYKNNYFQIRRNRQWGDRDRHRLWPGIRTTAVKRRFR
ncbi:hypothetical protein D3OALGA1CA_3357 [Olavius algarvensis associated proteobacterium Delta 3]|nr:hypothetical protein D3OALGB2SA_3117 [Olavius algarvensis associated proteobacterium Delta 3]CAB5133100.1 hypothetical protein D3OALGA1CA_3357 [Olavius algarvensis associated proteobacterium Delta 3]